MTAADRLTELSIIARVSTWQGFYRENVEMLSSGLSHVWGPVKQVRGPVYVCSQTRYGPRIILLADVTVSSYFEASKLKKRRQLVKQAFTSDLTRRQKDKAAKLPEFRFT
ncbi:hypothetical protein Bbelb_335040 [Branchiostoma belcheri]|nr:hypothetical protein Bbelb_335040 [Branchiostoma belcheri]